MCFLLEGGPYIPHKVKEVSLDTYDELETLKPRRNMRPVWAFYSVVQGLIIGRPKKKKKKFLLANNFLKKMFLANYGT